MKVLINKFFSWMAYIAIKRDLVYITFPDYGKKVTVGAGDSANSVKLFELNSDQLDIYIPEHHPKLL